MTVKERKIAFSNEWFTGHHHIKQAGHYPFCIYALLCYTEPMNGGITTTLENMMLWLGLDISKRRSIEKMKEALKYLHKHGMIIFYDDIQHSIPASMDIDSIKFRTPLYIDIKERPKDKYTLITVSEFKTLLLDKEHKGNSKVELICYFSAIMFHINAQTKIAFPSLELLNNEACVGRIETCSSYNDYLMDNLKLIKFQSSGVINPETGRIYPTQYVRYDDGDFLDKEIQRQTGKYVSNKISRMKKKNMSARAGISRRITNLKTKLSKYSEEDMYYNTSECIEIKKQIHKLEKERDTLKSEYEDLLLKGHLR